MIEAEQKSVRDLCDPARPITYGIVQPGKHTRDGVPVLRVNNFRAGTLDLSDAIRVAPEIESQFARSRPRPGDVLITLVGSIGQVAIAPLEIAGWNLARAVGLLPARDQHHAKWLACTLRAPNSQEFIQQRANTTVQATFNLRDLAELKVPYPSEHVRDAILEIVGGLDDKIELNRRMNETLEAMAQAIFRDWFVDLGPVRRQMEGATDPVAIMGGLTAAPARAKEVAALFPNALSDDCLPVGWTRAGILDLVPLRSGQTWPAGVREKNGVAVAFGANGAIGRSAASMGNGRVLFLGKIGSCGAINTHAGPFWATNNTYYLSKEFCPWLEYARMILHEIDWAPFIGGSSNPYMPLKNFDHLEVFKPSGPVLDAFECIAGSFRDRIEASHAENERLAETRDYLLPRLMSGAVRVIDAQSQDAAA